jgi:hypothetical protein
MIDNINIPYINISLKFPRYIDMIWFGHSVVCPSIYVSDYPFGIFKHLAIVLSVILFTTYDYSFGIDNINIPYINISLKFPRYIDMIWFLWYKMHAFNKGVM